MSSHYCPYCKNQLTTRAIDGIETNTVILQMKLDIQYPAGNLAINTEYDDDENPGASWRYDYTNQDIMENVEYIFLCPHCHAILDTNFVGRMGKEEQET